MKYISKQAERYRLFNLAYSAGWIHAMRGKKPFYDPKHAFNEKYRRGYDKGYARGTTEADERKY